ncbi:MAG: hypothetical protein WAX04_09920 [Oscillospiraceae bacterium]
MSRFFMYGTELQGLEQMMMLVPNFTPRGSGVVILNCLNYERGDVECRGCAQHKSCTEKCLCSKEKLKTSTIHYAEAIKDCFGDIKSNLLKQRLYLLGKRFNGELFVSESHKARFYHVCRMQNVAINERSSTYLATLFLLTADDMLWKISENAVCLNGFDFARMHLSQISTDSYALYLTAKTIHTGKEYIKISEIADESLIGDIAFKSIINAILIAKYGYDVLAK